MTTVNLYKEELMEKIKGKLRADGINLKDSSAVKKCLDGCVGSGLYEEWRKGQK